MKLAIPILIIVGVVAMQAQWAIIQFSLQSDLGLQYLHETKLSVEKSGIAKFDAGLNTKVIRAYGPYSHPNVMAGVCLIALTLLAFLSTKRVLPRSTFYLVPVLTLAILLSFSRAAFLGLLILAVVFSYSRQSILRKFFVSVVVLVLVFLCISPLWLDRLLDSGDLGVSERVSGSIFGWNILGDNLLLGFGPGVYELGILAQHLALSSNFDYWEIAPAHNAVLLLAAEWGVLFFAALFLVFTWSVWHRLNSSFVFLLPLLPLVFFDHYLATRPAPFLLVVLLFVVVLLFGDEREVLPKKI